MSYISMDPPEPPEFDSDGTEEYCPVCRTEGDCICDYLYDSWKDRQMEDEDDARASRLR